MVEAALFASTLSLDAMAAGFAYGANKTKIPIHSATIINLICSGILALSLFFGILLRPFLPQRLTVGLAFTLLFSIGIVKLLDGVMKSIIRKYSIDKKISGSLFNINFVLQLYANPQDADIDASKSISPTEAAILAVALSLDGMAVGFGAALANVNAIAVIAWSLLSNFAFLLLGCYLGSKVAQKSTVNVSWLSGVVLIVLAIWSVM